MNQQYPQFDSKIIETLKAARNQVVPDESPERSRGADKSGSLEISRPKVAAATPKEGGSLTGFAPLEARAKSTANTSGVLPLTGFAEEFVQKLTFVEKETAEIDEEMDELLEQARKKAAEIRGEAGVPVEIRAEGRRGRRGKMVVEY